MNRGSAGDTRSRIFASISHFRRKVAETSRDLVISTVHVGAVSAHGTDQPPKRDTFEGTSLRTTGVPSSNRAEHPVPQAMPGGSLVTDPEPVPRSSTVRRNCRMKCARTDLACVMDTVHGDVVMV